MEIIIIIFFGVILDFVFGDPLCIKHPVIIIGSLISKTEKFLRKDNNFKNEKEKKKKENFLGLILVLIVVLSVMVVTGLAVFVCYKIHFLLGLALEIFWCFQILATKSLRQESMKVKYALEKSLDEGRVALSWIVGRDTENMSEKAIIKGTVETVAENTCDGVIAPMIYLAIGGTSLAWVYKAINTMDSMIAYKNDKYKYFGTVAAILDDIANFIPARISAILMILSTKFVGLDFKNAVKIFKRDRKNHKSPNSAQTESVCAGALNVQLAGDAVYFGKLHKKPFIGDNNREINLNDIAKTNDLMYATTILCAVICIAIRFVLFVF